jgi:hypothetical protein
MKKCLVCRHIYQLRKGISTKGKNSSKFCNRFCYSLYQKNHSNFWPPSQKGTTPWNKGRGVFQNCKNCKEEFYVIKSRKNIAKYCSRQCTSEDFKKRTVSLEIRRKISDHSPNKGENCRFWRGGVSQVNKDFRNLFMQTVEYKFWRDSVFRRDNYTCKLCGDTKGGNLHSNHIKRFSDFPSLRLDVNNGITLCADCHMKRVTNHEIEFESYFVGLLTKGEASDVATSNKATCL